jgi:hypothetical protein
VGILARADDRAAVGRVLGHVLRDRLSRALGVGRGRVGHDLLKSAHKWRNLLGH